MPGKVLRHSAAFNFYAEEEGVLASISGVEKVDELESVDWFAVNKKPGDQCKFSRNGGYPVAEAILANKDRQKLDADIAAMEAALDIKTRPWAS